MSMSWVMSMEPGAEGKELDELELETWLDSMSVIAGLREEMMTGWSRELTSLES